MAEEEDDDDLEFEPADAGFSFRAEMWAKNVLMGYWKAILAVLITGLVGILFYGQYQSWYLMNQRASASEIFDAVKDLDDGATPEDYTKAAEMLERIAETARGTARTEALLRAADYYRQAVDPEGQNRALTTADAKPSTGVLGYAVDANLANLALERGDGDDAVARMRKLADQSEGYLAEQATLDLGLMYEHLERVDEARALYIAFLTDFPDSASAEQVRVRQRQLGGEG